MKLDAYVYIHVIYNTRGPSIVIHCWTTVQDVKKYIMHWILAYNEDNLYAIRREAIPWGLTSIYSYLQLKSRIYHIVKCQGCTVKQSPLLLYLVCLINYPPHPFLSLWAVHLEKWEIKLCLYSQRTANDSFFLYVLIYKQKKKTSSETIFFLRVDES